MATASALPKSGSVSKGYNFASTCEQNTPLTEQHKSAIARALSQALAERPFPVNLGKCLGKDGGADVAEKESALEEAGAMDAVLVNTLHISVVHLWVPVYDRPSCRTSSS